MATKIIKSFEPAYYQKFACTAGACQYTCCQGWTITCKRGDYNKVRSARVSAELRQKIESYIKRNKASTSDFDYAAIVLNDTGHCSFLSPEGLCSIQLECGAGMLSHTCKIFPRLLDIVKDHYTQRSCSTVKDHYTQRSCSTGCEAVVALLAQEKDGMRFVEYERELEQGDLVEHGGRAEKGTPLAEAEPFFPQVQALCIAILQDRRYTLAERVILLGMALSDFDKAAEDHTIPDWLSRRMALVTVSDVNTIKQTLAGLPAAEDASISVNNTFTLAMRRRITSQDVEEIRLINDAMVALGVEVGNIVLQVVSGDNNAVDAPGIDVSYDNDKYKAAQRSFSEVTQGMDYLLENVLVNYFFSKLYPLRNAATAWDAYMIFCNVYRFFDIICMGYVAAHPQQGSYEHALTVCSRMMYHNDGFLQAIANNLHKTGSDTLAYMAVLVNN